MEKTPPKFTGFIEIVTPQSTGVEMQDGVRSDGAEYSNFSWYQKMVYGSSSRVARYSEYDQMDTDLDISQALDIVAEEMTSLTGNYTKLPVKLDLNIPLNGVVDDGIVPTLNAALATWCKVQQLDQRLFDICRNMIKYGDVFFIRPEKPNQKWRYVPVSCVLAAVVNGEDISKIRSFICRLDNLDANSAMTGQMGYRPVASTDAQADEVPMSRLIRFTLNNDMSVEAPFGISPLSYVYRSYKKKQLLEDAIVIYRIQRAPERRVFYIDVGKMPPQRTKSFLEQVKNDMKTKQAPNLSGGAASVDTIYNPQSMSEDFYFAVRPGGSNSRVETLPGGQNLGELTDLEYFRTQVLQGFRIPPSYIPSMQGLSSMTPITDGQNGTLYMAEIQFTKSVRRFQTFINRTLDAEFKLFVKQLGLKIDSSLFSISLNPPTNYEEYREAAINTELLNAYSNAEGIPHLSKRFAMKKYLRLNDADIVLNEQMWREEHGIPENKYSGIMRVYNPESMDMDGSDDMGGSFGGGSSLSSPTPPSPKSPIGDSKSDVKPGDTDAKTDVKPGDATSKPGSDLDDL